MPRLAAGMLVRIIDTSDVGTLIQIRESSQTCVIKLNDGTLKKNVPLDDVKEATKSDAASDTKSPIRLASAALALPPSTSSSTSASGEPRLSPMRQKGSWMRFDVGDSVRARYKRGTKWYDGTIMRVRSDGTFDIKYADGDTATQVDAQYIEPKEGGERLSPVKASTSQTKSSLFAVGDRVKARYKKGSKLFGGKITKVHDDDTYDVRYDDGDVETRVDATYIQADAQEEKALTQASPSPKKSTASKSRVRFDVGDRVRARYKRGAKYFNGRITKAHVDGSFDIKYEDGDVETRVDVSYIENAETDDDDGEQIQAKLRKFQVGNAVRARYKGGTKFFPAKVTKIHSDGTYDLRYDDGDVEKRVKADNIEAEETETRASRPLSPLKSSSKQQQQKQQASPRVGDKVKARYNRSAKYVNGTIAKMHSDGTYDIRYEDGDSEKKVDTKYIEFLVENEDEREANKGTKYRVGDTVRARYKRGKKLYIGRIKRAHSDGTYDIEYEAGDVETRVDAEYMEASEESSKASSPKKMAATLELSVGDRVKARYKRGAKLFSGKIQRVRSDGTYDIKYEDGDVETSVESKYIEKAEVSSSVSLEIGDRVTVKAKRGSRTSTGRITKCHASEDTYDVKYDDGETETRVTMDRLEREDRDEGEPESAAGLQVGGAVKARYKKGSKMFPGTITRVRADGTFDVQYEDGDVERRVEAAYIEAVTKPKFPSKKVTAKARALEVGDVVKARYKTGIKLYRGTIKRIRSDGTYDIKYEDGDVETLVAREYIQTSDDEHDEEHDKQTSNKKTKHTFEVGDAVRARYKKGIKWYAGRIKRVRSDGTYDVKYEDGDVETGVDSTKIEATVASSPSKKTTTQDRELQEGDQVKARCKGGKKLYTGVVTRVRTDGSYDIRYDDGETELRVAREMIEGDAASDELKAGDAVTAAYKGGKKMYKGKITRVRANGTYDIEYEDEDLETRVIANKIQREHVDDKKGKKDQSLKIGDRVRAKHSKSKGRLVRGEISRVRSDGTFDVLFDDDEKAMYLERGDLVTESETEEEEEEEKTPKFGVGDAVSVRYKNGSKWFNGTVKRVRSDGTMDIKYDDGDEEERVKPEKVKTLEKTKKTPSTEHDDDSDSLKDRKLKKGDDVEADYKGRGRYKRCEIVRVHRDGSVDVEYEDGTEEREVPRDRMRSRGDGKAKPNKSKAKESYESDDDHGKPKPKKPKHQDSSSSESSSDSGSSKKKKKTTKKPTIIKGSRVTMRKATDSRSRRIGHVKKLRSGGSCDIRYRDGDVAKRIAVDTLLLCSDEDNSEVEGKASKAHAKVLGTFKRDQPVVACWHRSSKLARAKMTDQWENAVVLALTDQGRYSIKYRSGEMAEDVPEEAIKPREAESTKGAIAGSPRRYERDLSETDVVFLLEQLALSLYEERAMKKKPRVRMFSSNRTNDTSSSSSSSSESSASDASNSEDEGKRSDRSSRSTKHERRKLKKRARPGSAIAKVLHRLFEPKLLAKYQSLFAERDAEYTGRISRSKLIELVEQQIAATPGSSPSISTTSSVSGVRRFLSDWFENQDSLRVHSKFDIDMFWLAFAVAKHHQSKERITQNVANALDARFASHHETKKQLELWQQKLGFRVFELLQRSFHDSAIARLYPAQVRVRDLAMIFDQVTKSAVPAKPLDVYLSQMHLLPHHTLHLPEFLCCYYQLYGSAESSKPPAWTEQLELRPLAFVASCLFSNGDVCCGRHGDLIRRLCVGRTPAQVDLIMRFREVFESLVEDEPATMPTSKLDMFVSKVTSDASILEQAVLALKKRTASVSLVELFATCGFAIDELTSAPTVANAIEKMRLRTDAAEVRRIITLVRSMCLNVLRFPNNSDYWRLRCDSAAFQHKIGRVDGATNLLEAVGFVEYGKSHYELRGARTLDGKKASCLTKQTLDTLRDKCAELDAELSVMDGVESVVSILQRSTAERPMSLDECEQVLRHLAVYIDNVLKNPKDSRCWRIRESNKTYQRQIGYLPGAIDLMASIGYDLVASSQGNVFVLRGTGLNTKETSGEATASLANFAFSTVSQQMEWFLWRRRQEIDSLLQDDMDYLVQTLGQSVGGAATRRTCVSGDRMYPYGHNATEIFNKSTAQKAQLQMMKAVFDALDSRAQGYLTANDFAHAVAMLSTPAGWAMFEAFDLNKDDRVDLADFVGALGPALDHSFDPLNAGAFVPFERMTLSEQLSTMVGRLRLTVPPVEVIAALDQVISCIMRVIDQPDSAAVREIATKSPLSMHASRILVVKDILHAAGFREPSPATEIAFVLRPSYATTGQQVRFKTSQAKDATSTLPLHQQTLSRLQLIVAILAGHARILLFPAVSDVGAVARALAEMRPIASWVKLIELASLCLDNILKNAQNEARYRQIKTSTPTFTSVVASVQHGVSLLLALGFRETDRGTLLLPDDVSRAQVIARKLELDVGCQALKIVDKLIASGFQEEDGSADRLEAQGTNAVEYYKRKALAADLAREEALRKSAHLEKQLELVAKTQGRRQVGIKSAPMTPKARPKSSQVHGDRTHALTQAHASIEAEILASFSPRKHEPVEATKQVIPQRLVQRGMGSGTRGRSGSKPTTPTNQAQRQAKTTQRRPSAPISSTTPSLHETSLAMDSDAGSQFLVLRSTNAHVQSGALVRVGTECRDLTEERVVVLVDSTTFPSMTRVQLHSPLQFPHYTRDLVFILPASAIEKAIRIPSVEAWVRSDIVSDIIDRILNSLGEGLRTPVRPMRSDKTRPHATTMLAPLCEIHHPSSNLTIVGGNSHEVMVAYSSARPASDAFVVYDCVGHDKLRAVWEGLVLEYGNEGSGSGVSWHRLHSVLRRIPAIAMYRPLQPASQPSKDSIASWRDFLQWLGIHLNDDDIDAANDSAEQALALALLWPQFHAMRSNRLDENGVFHVVPVDDLTKRAASQLLLMENSENETRDRSAVHQLLQRVPKVLQQPWVAWPEIAYCIRHDSPLAILDLFTRRTPLTGNEATRCVAAVVVSETPEAGILVLFIDGSLEIWRRKTSRRSSECVNHCIVLMPPLSPSTSSTAKPDTHRSFMDEYTSVVMKASRDPAWSQVAQHKVEASLTSFLESTSDQRTLLWLACHDSCLFVNATMVSDGGLMVYHVDSTLGAIRPLRRVRPMHMSVTLKRDSSSGNTSVSSGGQIESFLVCGSGVIAYTLIGKSRGVVWLVAGDTGSVITYIDAFAYLTDQRMLLTPMRGESSTICVASTQAAIVHVVKLADDGKKKTLVCTVAPSNQRSSTTATVVSVMAIATLNNAVVGAFTNGTIAVWCVDDTAWAAGHLTPATTQQTKMTVQQLLTFGSQGPWSPFHTASRSRIQVSDEDEKLLERWDGQLTAKNCVRLALYLLANGSVVDVPVVDAFTTDLVTWTNPSQRGSTPREDRVFLQPERVLRVILLAVEYRRDGFFAQKSMKELLGDIIDRHLLLKTQKEMKKHLDGYSDNLVISWRCYYGPGDSSECELVPPENKVSLKVPGTDVFTLGIVGRSSDKGKSQATLQVWSCSRSPPTLDVQLVKRQHVLQLEAHRIQRQKGSSMRSTADTQAMKHITHCVEQMKTTLGQQFTSEPSRDDKQRLAETLLHCLQAVNATWAALRRGPRDPVEAWTVEDLFRGQRDPVPVDDLLEKLRSSDKFDATLTPWVHRLRSLFEQESPRQHSDLVAVDQVVLAIRRWRRDFLSFDVLSRVVEELGVLSRSSHTDLPCLIRQQFISFARDQDTASEDARKPRVQCDSDSDYHRLLTFIHPRLAVEFILQASDITTRLEQSIHVLEEQLHGIKPATTESLQSTETLYAHLLLQRRLATRLSTLDSRLQSIETHVSNAPPLTSLVGPAAVRELRCLLKTALPEVAPTIDSVTVSIPISCRQVTRRLVVDAFSSVCPGPGPKRIPLSVVVCGADTARQYQQETAFYRHVHKWKTRELFLPVIVSGFDAAIINSDRIPVSCPSDLRTIVCESIQGWQSIAHCINHLRSSQHHVSLSHWQPLVAFWCRQVMLSVAVLDEDGLVLELLGVDDVIVSPDGKSVRLARLSLSQERAHGTNVRVVGAFVLQLIRAFDGRHDEPVRQSNDYATLKQVHTELVDVWSRHGVTDHGGRLSRLMSAVDLCKELEEVTGSADAGVVAVVASALLALHPCESSRPDTVGTLWTLTMAGIAEEAPLDRAAELATIVEIQTVVEDEMLRPLATLAECNVDALTAATVVDAALDSLRVTSTRLLELQDDSSWTRDVRQSILRALTTRSVLEMGVVRAIHTFETCIQSSQRHAANRVIHQALHVLTDIMHTVETQVSLASLIGDHTLQDYVCDVVWGVCILCGAPPASALIPVRSQPINAALWRLCESTLRELLGDSTNHSNPRYPLLHQFLASIVTTVDATVPLEASDRPVKRTSRSTPIALWWRQRPSGVSLATGRSLHTLPSQPRHGIEVSLSMLRSVYDTLELRFNSSSVAVAAAPKYRLAALQASLAAKHLDRLSAPPLAITHDTIAMAWLSLDMASTLQDLVRDPDSRIVYASLSILETYTRILRPPPTDKPLERRCFSTTSPAYRLALALCSRQQLFIDITRLLSHQVRLLKVLGETGVVAAVNNSRYSVATKTANPVALLSTALAFLANCLYAGDASTRHWITTGLGSFIVAQTKAQSLAFVRVVEMSWMNQDSPSMRRWQVFHSTSTVHGSTHVSPFERLLKDLVLCCGARNVVLLAYLRRTSPSFRKLVEEAFVDQGAKWPTVELVLARDFGHVHHALSVVRDVDECDGTLAEKAAAVEYSASVIQTLLTLNVTWELPSAVRTICLTVWTWVEMSWDATTGDPSKHEAVVTQGLQLLHIVSTVSYRDEATLPRLMEMEGDRVESVFSMLLSRINKVPEPSSRASTSLVRMTLELMVGLVCLHDEKRAKVVMLECVGLPAVLTLMETDATALCGSFTGESSSVSHVLHLKTRLWAAVLRLCGRDDVRWLINNGLVDHWTTTLLNSKATRLDDPASVDVDALHSSINQRLEVTAVLEILLHSLQLLGLRHSLPGQLWTTELTNCILHHRVLLHERQCALAAVRFQQHHVGSQHATVVAASHRLSATAKRMVQLVCCLAIDPATNDVHAVINEELSAVGIPSHVVQWHQQAEPTVDRDPHSIRDFWDAWPLGSVLSERTKPKPPYSTLVQAPLKKPVPVKSTVVESRVKFVPVDPPSQVKQLITTARQMLTTRTSSLPARQSKPPNNQPGIPLDRLLSCLGEEVAVLQAIFDHHANTAKHEKLLDPSRVMAALRECNATSSTPTQAAITSPLSFSQYLHVYATQSGLVQACESTRDRSTVVFVWRGSGTWTTLPRAHLQAMESAVERLRLAPGALPSTTQVVDVLQRIHRGVFSKQELTELVKNELARVPTKQHRVANLAALTSVDLRRALAAATMEAAKRPTVQRLLLQSQHQKAGSDTSARPGVPVSPVQVHSGGRHPSPSPSLSPRQASMNPLRESMVQTLLSIDMESALALQHRPGKQDERESIGSDAYSPFSDRDASDSDKSTRQRAPRKPKRRVVFKSRDDKSSSRESKEVRRASSSSASDDSREHQRRRRLGHDDSSSSSSSSSSSRSRSRSSSRSSSSSSSSSSSRSSSGTLSTIRRKRRHRRQPSKTPQTKTATPTPTAALRQVFAKYDADGDGVISFADLRRVLQGVALSHVELHRWIAEKDRRGVGAVDLDDFAHAFADRVDHTTVAAATPKSPAEPAQQQRRVVLSNRKKKTSTRE